MKNNKLLSLLIILFLLLNSCKNENNIDSNGKDYIEPTIMILGADDTIESYGGSQGKISFSVNTSWTATVNYMNPTDNWLSISSERGEAGENIIIDITVGGNSTNAKRVAYISIQYDGKEYKHSITQSEFKDRDVTSDFEMEFAYYLFYEKRLIPSITKIMLSDLNTIEEISTNSTFRISSLNGIEHFTSLKKLHWLGPITSLDLSNNRDLVSLTCNFNKLDFLDLSKNTKLSELNCTNSYLSFLDISKNTELVTFNCKNSIFTTLDLSKNPKLQKLDCSENNFFSLDISKNTELTELYCNNNNLSSLGIDKNTKLKKLECHNNKITSLDINKNKELSTFRCHNNLGKEGKFIVTSWFDANNIPYPYGYTQVSWTYDDNTVEIVYQKVK